MPMVYILHSHTSEHIDCSIRVFNTIELQSYYYSLMEVTFGSLYLEYQQVVQHTMKMFMTMRWYTTAIIDQGIKIANTTHGTYQPHKCILSHRNCCMILVYHRIIIVTSLSLYSATLRATELLNFANVLSLQIFPTYSSYMELQILYKCSASLA